MANSKTCDIDAIVAGYRNGASLRKLAALHGVSHESIRKLLASAGLDRLDGGGAIATLRNIRARANRAKEDEARREARIRRHWGMTSAEYDAHVTEFGDRNVPRSPMRAYRFHQQKAVARGIAWGFTFKEWWQVWLESGKWESRGRHANEYVMARFGDGDAPYSRDTVYICTASENLKDGFIALPYNERKLPCRKIS